MSADIFLVLGSILGTFLLQTVVSKVREYKAIQRANAQAAQQLMKDAYRAEKQKEKDALDKRFDLFGTLLDFHKDEFKKELGETDAYIDETVTNMRNIDSSVKAIADFANQVEKRVERIEKRLTEIHEALANGVHAVDKEARDAYQAMLQRHGAFEQALGIQDSTIRQVMAVLVPPRTREEVIAQQAQHQAEHVPAHATPRLTMEQQIQAAREAAIQAGAQ